MSPQPDLAGFADRKVVKALLEELRVAWERILNDYADAHDLETERGGVRYVDAQMTLHNFFKLGLDHLVEESRLTGEAAAALYLAAGETFKMSMRARAEEMRTGRPAGSRPDDPNDKGEDPWAK